VFVPVSDRVAAPVFTRVALVPEITPERVPVPDETSTLPDVVILTLLAAVIPEASANVVPLAMLSELVPKAVLFPRERVPSDRVVVPEQVFATERTIVPAPSLMTPLPEIAPPRVALPDAIFSLALLIKKGVATDSPSCSVKTVVADERRKQVLVPKAVFVVIATSPAETEVCVCELFPVRVRDPALDFVSRVPLIVPERVAASPVFTVIPKLLPVAMVLATLIPLPRIKLALSSSPVTVPVPKALEEVKERVPPDMVVPPE
jgi:hypothetical protein